MKKLYLLATMLLCLSSVPSALNAETVTVVSDNSSGMTGVNRTATLDDGTVLGFYLSGSSARFCGAITTKTSLEVPDSIMYNSSLYAVTYCGRAYTGEFNDITTVESLTLPETVTYLYALPATVKTLHLNSALNGLYSNDILKKLNQMFVPLDLLDYYYENGSWSDYVLITEEGKEALKLTVDVTKPGEFAQLFLQQTDDNWYKVNDLTVTGTLSEDDLNVFKRMRQLTRLDLSGATITDIPKNFDGATSFYDGYTGGFNLLEELILPEVESIGEYAFSQCTRLTKITLPGVKNIGYGAFAYVGASNVELPDGLTTIGNNAFYKSRLERIQIPDNVTLISSECFYKCGKLSEVILPTTVKTIGDYSFAETAVSSLDLSDIQSVGSRSFYKCEELENVKFGQSLTKLEGNAFENCKGLTEIDLPSSLLNVSAAFHSCSNIKKVICRAVTPPTHSSFILYNCDMTDVKLYVPDFSIDTYRAATNWKNFYTILPLEDKTSNLYVNGDLTIDDASNITSDCFLSLSNKATLDYNGSQTFSMKEYFQVHNLGSSSYQDNYSGNAKHSALIANGPMRADEVYTSFSVPSTYIWYFISLPYNVKVSDIEYPEECQFVIRKYSGADRAQQTGNTWQDLTADDTMNAYEGYILRCNKENSTFVFPAMNDVNKNKVFETESVIMPLGEYLSEFEHNRSWNLVGNPYPCYYDTRRMDFTAPITVWNRYYERYDAYSPVDDEYILHPAEAFFVQRPVDKASITFDKAGRQKTSAVQELPSQSKKRVTANGDNRKVFNLTLSDGVGTDRTRFVINEAASVKYELDKDASKLIDADNEAMLVYTVDNGVRYAINERPRLSGEIGLGLYAPKNGTYTLALENTNGEDVMLLDKECDMVSDLNGSYTFNAVEGYSDNRFTIMFGNTTGVNNIVSEEVRVNVENGMLSVNAPQGTLYSVFSTDGRKVAETVSGNSVSLVKGIYIVTCKDVKRKIVVK